MKQLIFGKTCSLWYCLKRPDLYLQLSAGKRIKTIPYCAKHARIADELFREGEIEVEGLYNYHPLKR